MSDEEKADELEYILKILSRAMEELDHIEVDQNSPVEEHITGAYQELLKAWELAKNLRKALPYSED